MYFLPIIALTVIAVALNDGLLPTEHPKETSCGSEVHTEPDVQPAGHAGGWTLVFSDEFAGAELDPGKWTTCYWWGAGGCTNASNSELEWYQPDEVIVGEGGLRLRAQRRAIIGSNGMGYSFTSGMVTTGRDTSDRAAPPRFVFQYGYAEIRAKVPAGRGLWPAFWLLPQSHDSKPEIDVMEILGHDPGTIYMNLHYLRANGTRARSDNEWTGPDFSTGWHTFAVDWRPDGITWFVDGSPIANDDAPTHIPAVPMYLLLNLAVGGNWPGSPDAATPFPSHFDVDYVRVWRPSLSILPGDIWRYRDGRSEPPSDWKEPAFDDSSWLSGPSGFGYADEDDATVLADMSNNYSSIYIRRAFTVTDPSQISGLTLAVDFDDGFVAYLNGVEVARANLVGARPAHSALAVEHEASGGCRCTTAEVFDLGRYRNLLAPGVNVLAIQGHNAALASTDFSLIPTLIADEAQMPQGSPPPSVDSRNAPCGGVPVDILPAVETSSGATRDAS